MYVRSIIPRVNRTVDYTSCVDKKYSLPDGKKYVNT